MPKRKLPSILESSQRFLTHNVQLPTIGHIEIDNDDATQVDASSSVDNGGTSPSDANDISVFAQKDSYHQEATCI